MLLRELLDNVNKILEDNMKKEVIKTYWREYDMINGRRVIDEYDIKNMITNLCYSKSLCVNINKAVNLNFLGIKFKLKRKKSDILSSWNRSNMLTYTQINIEKEYEDKLDLEIEIIEQEYRDSIKKESDNKKQQELNNVNKFKTELKSYNINLKDFLILERKYNSLSYNEQRSLLGK